MTVMNSYAGAVHMRTLTLMYLHSPGRDGTFRLWNGSDLRHFKTMSMGSSWITDCIYMASVSC